VFASKKNILDKNSLAALSKLIFNLFQPCLLFVSVSSTVSAARIAGNSAALAVLPALAVLQILVGSLMGKALSFVLYNKDPQSEGSRFLKACTAFSNSGPLPFVFVDALFRSHADPSLLFRSQAYISMYLLGWSPL
jgi:predicted permease